MEAEVRPVELATQPPTHPPTPPPQTPTSDAVFHAISTYPFSTDADFQTGLASILGPSSTATVATDSETVRRSDTILQAQCFYFARYETSSELFQPNLIAPPENTISRPSTTQPTRHGYEKIRPIQLPIASDRHHNHQPSYNLPLPYPPLPNTQLLPKRPTQPPSPT